MERNSIFYKLRRKGQVFASKVLPDELICKIYSKVILKKKVNLKKPETFNEKIQWMKLYYYPNNELVINGSDKFKVREYLKIKGLENILVPLIADWKRVDDIEWDKLPQKFVIKCNHGCAYNILCNDKSKINISKTTEQINKWMKEDFGAFNIERHYSKIIPHITCEKYLGESIVDYKFFCFNGEPTYLYISSDLVHDRQAKIGFFNMDGTKMQLVRDDYEDINIEKFPEYFNRMKNDAKILAKDFPFVRVDFFVTKDRYYFAELTFTPSGGMMPFNPEHYDLDWGKLIELPKI